MNKVLFSIIMVLFITGCVNKPQRVVVTDKQLVYVSIPKHFLTECKTTKPFKKDIYLYDESGKDNTFDVKESMLTSYIISLHKDIATCNKQINSISEFDRDQNLLINKKK